MAQTKVKLISDGVIVQSNLHASHGITTAHIGEGSNLYYTDARVSSYLSTNSFATESYVGTQITNLVDSSPSALNTLNELAAALGDDANFSTTVTNSIALKAPIASPTFTGFAKAPYVRATSEGDIALGGISGISRIQSNASNDIRFLNNSNQDLLTLVASTRAATFAGNVIIHNSSNAPYIDFVENADTGDSKARITMDQIDTNNGTLFFATENAGTLFNQVKITQTGNLLLSNDAASFNTSNAKLNVLPASSGVYQQWNYSPSNDNFSLKLKETVTAGNVRYVFEQINNTTTYPNTLVFNQGSIGIGSLNPYAFDTTATKLHVKNPGSSGSVVEVARFEGSPDASGSGGTIRLGTSNDRGIYFEGGRTATVPYGKIGLTEYNGAKTPIISLFHDSATNFSSNVTANGIYTAGNSVIIYKAQRNGGAVAGDWSYDDATTDMSLGTSTAHSFSLKTGNTRALTINSSQNVGIGTATPQTTLEVKGAASALNAHFGQGTNNSSGVFGGISLGYSEANTAYRKVGIVAQAKGDNSARQDLHFLVDTVNDQNSAEVGDSKMHIQYNTGDVIINNKLGIGTTLAQQPLHVQSTGDLFTRYQANSNANGVQFQTWHGNSQTMTINSNTTNPFAVYVGSASGTIAINVDSNANVGIGTTSPGRGLTIDKSNANAALEIIKKNTTNQIVYLGTGSSGGTDDPLLRMFHNTTENIRLYTTGDSWINGGNVGIGTTSPSTKLVVAQSNVTEPSGVDANTSILIKNNTWSGMTLLATSSTGSFLTFGDENAGFAGRIQYIHSNDNMIFETAATERMRITNAGLVGIGENSPVAQLDVQLHHGTGAFNKDCGARIGRIQYAWHTGQYYANNSYSYVHYKTNLWMGGSHTNSSGYSGNTHYIMGGFYIKSYKYGSLRGDGSVMFHNWSGGFAGLTVENSGNWTNFVQSPYTSSDGFCVIVLSHNYYSAPNIDFHQSFTAYPWRNVQVTASSQSNSTTGVY